MRLFNIRRRIVPLAAVAVVGGAIFVALAVHPAAPLASHMAGQVSSSSTSASNSSPMVAGDSTTAPTPAHTPAATSPGTVRGATAAPKATTPPATSVPAPEPAVKLMLSDPDGQFAYAVPAAEVSNACDILTAAKAHGLLRSVKMANYPSLHSYYVDEINGYQNNWTFKVNGVSPKGCSLAQVSKGDIVSWIYQ